MADRQKEFEEEVTKLMHQNLDEPLDSSLRDREKVYDLQKRYIDVIREQFGFNGDDNTLNFPEKWEGRWREFFKDHIVKMGEKDTCFYKDKNEKYRIIPDEHMHLDEMKFFIENFKNFVCEPEVQLDCLPSFNIMGQVIELPDDYMVHLPKEIDEFTKDGKYLEHQLIIAMIGICDFLNFNKEIKKDKLYIYLKEHFF